MYYVVSLAWLQELIHPLSPPSLSLSLAWPLELIQPLPSQPKPKHKRKPNLLP